MYRIREKIPNLHKGGAAGLFMDEEEVWRVTDLLDPKQPFVEDVQLARQMVQTLHALDAFDRESFTDGHHESGIVNLNVRTPKAALEFVESTLSEWFDTVAEIEKRRGNLPYLINRSLYSGGKIEWNQGLVRDDIETWMGDSPYGLGEYPYLPSVSGSEEPISGYCNRILPVKFVLRIMAMLTLNSESFDRDDGWDRESEFDEDGIELKTLREKAWETAAYAREDLVLMDESLSTDYVDPLKWRPKISVGFPTKDTKSKERFVSQFVGSKRGNELSGSLFDMGFANMSSLGIGNKLRVTFDSIWFTPEGWRFATMENPVIDQTEGWEEGNRFSDDEVKFLLAHFQKKVPAEWSFLKEIAGLIDSGDNRPSALEKSIIKNRGWETTKASMMRNGALSRMQELGLISRAKKGREVTYSLTESGKSHFEL